MMAALWREEHSVHHLMTTACKRYKATVKADMFVSAIAAPCAAAPALPEAQHLYSEGRHILSEGRHIAPYVLVHHSLQAQYQGVYTCQETCWPLRKGHIFCLVAAPV